MTELKNGSRRRRRRRSWRSQSVVSAAIERLKREDGWQERSHSNRGKKITTRELLCVCCWQCSSPLACRYCCCCCPPGISSLGPSSCVVRALGHGPIISSSDHYNYCAWTWPPVCAISPDNHDNGKRKEAAPPQGQPERARLDRMGSGATQRELASVSLAAVKRQSAGQTSAPISGPTSLIARQ